MGLPLLDFDDADDDEEVVKVKAKRVRNRTPKADAGAKASAEVVADPILLGKVKADLEELRVKGNHLFRYVTYRGDVLVRKELGDVCSQGLKQGPGGRGDYNKNWVDVTIGLAFNGQSPQDKSGPTGKLGGGELSLAWLKFLLDPNESPWAEVIPSVVNREDTDWINEAGGLIFQNFQEIGGNVFGGFIIATRYCQEHHSRGAYWLELVKGGMNPRLAYIMVSTCNAAGNSVANGGHMPIGSPSPLWMKACWERKGILGSPVGTKGYTGGDPLYNDSNSPEYKAFYGYDNNSREKNRIKFGNFDEVLSQVKERIGYAE